MWMAPCSRRSRESTGRDVASMSAHGRDGRVIRPDAGARNAGNDGRCLFLLRIGDARHGCAACEGESTRGDVERTGRMSRQLEQIGPDHHLTEVEFVSGENFTNPNRKQYGFPSPSPLHKSWGSKLPG